MTTKETKRLAILWEGFRDAIDNAYQSKTGRVDTLRDYVRNHGMEDKTETLLHKEMMHERRHRGGRRCTLPVRQAAMMVILHNVATYHPFDAIDSLSLRDTAFETNVITSLILPFLTAPWLAEAKALDYPEAMKE